MQGYAVHNDKSYTIYIQYLQHHIHISTGGKKQEKKKIGTIKDVQYIQTVHYMVFKGLLLYSCVSYLYCVT